MTWILAKVEARSMCGKVFEGSLPPSRGNPQPLILDYRTLSPRSKCVLSCEAPKTLQTMKYWILLWHMRGSDITSGEGRELHWGQIVLLTHETNCCHLSSWIGLLWLLTLMVITVIEGVARYKWWVRGCRTREAQRRMTQSWMILFVRCLFCI